jgi:hypothetical protein
MIEIVDNFFIQKDLEKIQDFVLNKAYYTPRYFNNTTERNQKNFYGNRFDLYNDTELLNLFKKQSELKFNIKITKINENSGIDQRNLNHFKPHTDEIYGKINILIMLYGPIAVTNGTVFYTDNELDMHIGFRPNRAILFSSNKLHSQHASKIPNLLRYTATLFIEDCKLF